MIKPINRQALSVTPFKASKSWELYNIQNDSEILLEPKESGVDIDDTSIAMDYIDYSGTPILNRECNIALEQQTEDLAFLEEGISGSGRFYPESEPRNYTGTYKRLLYNQIKQAFYNQNGNPLEIFGMENIDFPSSLTTRYLAENFRMLTIPQQIFGDKVVEGSVQFFDNSLDDNVTIRDDSNGNLVATSNLFSKIQEIRSMGNIIVTGSVTSSYVCPGI